MKCVVLALDPGVLDHTSCVGLEARHCTADVGVYLYYLFDGGGDEQRGGHTLFDAEKNAVGCCDLDVEPCWKEID
jgi:hypothetical protein